MREGYDNWEQIPSEDLWEDGEIGKHDLARKLYVNIVAEGKWIVLRRLNKGETNEEINSKRSS